jgi:chaperonin GroES
MPTKLRPLADRVVVSPFESAEKTPGGIVLPDSAQEVPQRGMVIAVGAGKLLGNGQRSEFTVEVGDEVVYGRYAGTDLALGDGREVKVLRESDILAKVE